MMVKMPYQCFINGQFTDADDGKTYDTINPTDGSTICKVSYASLADVDKAVAAAKDAFENGRASSKGKLLRLQGLKGQEKELLLESGKICSYRRKPHSSGGAWQLLNHSPSAREPGNPIPQPLFPSVHQSSVGASQWPLTGQAQWESKGTRLADLLEENQEELATIEALDSGAVYTLALKTHIGMSVQTFRYFAGWCDKIQGSTIPINQARPNRNLTFTKKEPLGVCAIIIPWNYPLMMLAWKSAACLAAGNTLVLKPAQCIPVARQVVVMKIHKVSVPMEITVWLYLQFKTGSFIVEDNLNPENERPKARAAQCDVLRKAQHRSSGIVPKSGIAGQRLSEHPDIRKLGFTGSTPIGKQIMKSCAVSNLKKVSLELGGKSPLIIFNDCELDKAGMGAVFFNKGENCIAAGRLFVEESIHDEFVTRVVEEIKKMKIGDPLDRSTDHGPQNHKAHLEKLLQYCETGVKEGATLVYGGRQVQRPGFFMEPTVFTDVEDHMYLAKEESFGPIMVISKFQNGDIDGVLQRANNTEYGLASGVFTRDINKAMYVSEKLEAGTVFINTYNKTDVAAPFGGVKQSGFGKDLGEEALNEYLKTKTVTLEY
ncbi:hypothetical protein H8959_014845 [Pygathrix nigripes]